MIRRSFRRGLGLGLLVGAVAAVVKMVQARRPGQGEIRVETYTGNAANEHFADAGRQQERPLSDWEPTTPLPEPEETTPLTPDPVMTDDPAPAPASAPVKKKVAPRKKGAPKSVDPVDGVCPDTHPVKGKLASGLFHQPGGFAYPRTKPDRCYVDAAAAEADGLRPAKR